MIDRSLLCKGDEFEDLVDTYVIFITENDKFGMGIPLYHVERRITEMEYALFADGAHIIYVNGEYRNMEHPVGCLMYDFHCKDCKRHFESTTCRRSQILKRDRRRSKPDV